jgi:hypothetical protein
MRTHRSYYGAIHLRMYVSVWKEFPSKSEVFCNTDFARKLKQLKFLALIGFTYQMRTYYATIHILLLIT